jgi:hypothetical protein
MTRFEIVVTRRVRESHNITVDGVREPATSVTVSETIDEVLCSWCGKGDAVRELGRTGAV